MATLVPTRHKGLQIKRIEISPYTAFGSSVTLENGQQLGGLRSIAIEHDSNNVAMATIKTILPKDCEIAHAPQTAPDWMGHREEQDVGPVGIETNRIIFCDDSQCACGGKEPKGHRGAATGISWPAPPQRPSDCDFKTGFDVLMSQVRIIGMLPVERWLEELEHSESVAPILDPTLYRNYLYSGKGDVIKKILRAALELKRTLEECQSDVLDGKVRG